MNGRASTRRAWSWIPGWAPVWILTWVVLLCACVSEKNDGPLWADPGVIRFDPTRAELEIAIHNTSGTVRPISDFQLAGEDWGSLRFVDDSLPRTVPANDPVLVRLASSPATFRTAPGVYRSGSASLRFSSDQHEFEIPIEFVGTASARPRGYGSGGAGPPIWLSSLLLALIAAAALLIPRRASSSSGAGLWTRLSSPSASTSGERIAVAGAIAASLLVAASIPFGAGLCRGRLGAPVGPEELAQCRAGLGGYELALLPAAPGVWWWVVALSVAATTLAVVRVRLGGAGRIEPTTGATIALSLVRVLGFAIVLAALLVGLAPADSSTTALVLAQARLDELGGLIFPAWGLVAQPLAFAATVALAIPAPANEGANEPLLAALARFERLLWAALITATFLAGWSIPGLSQRPVPPLTHGPTLLLELAAFALKLAAVDLALARLGQTLAKRDIQTPTLLRAQARWTIPLALFNLAAVLLWRAL